MEAIKTRPTSIYSDTLALRFEFNSTVVSWYCGCDYCTVPFSSTALFHWLYAYKWPPVRVKFKCTMLDNRARAILVLTNWSSGVRQK